MKRLFSKLAQGSEQSSRWLLDENDVKALLPSLPVAGHKGNYGRLSVVGGDQDYPGAPLLAAKAGYRAGAGLVRVVAEAAIFSQLIQDNHGIIHSSITGFDTIDLEKLYATLRLDDAIVLGPGWGREEVKLAFMYSLISELATGDVPLVLDADALAAIDVGLWPALKNNGRVVITPHPKELSRLSGLSIKQINADRLTVASQLAAKWGVFLLLKGANTVVATPEGMTYTFDLDVPALSVAGTGDVLAGLIGGLLAQGLSMLDALLVATYSHAAAAMSWQQGNGRRGMMADDLLDYIPRTLEALRQ